MLLVEPSGICVPVSPQFLGHTQALTDPRIQWVTPRRYLPAPLALKHLAFCLPIACDVGGWIDQPARTLPKAERSPWAQTP